MKPSEHKPSCLFVSFVPEASGSWFKKKLLIFASMSQPEIKQLPRVDIPVSKPGTTPSPKRLHYYFEEVVQCEMCGDPSAHHKILGQRLNQSQGLNPKQVAGISVTVKKCSKCSLIYSSPQPIPFDIQDHYGMPPESYWKDEERLSWHPQYFAKEIAKA